MKRDMKQHKFSFTKKDTDITTFGKNKTIQKQALFEKLKCRSEAIIQQFLSLICPTHIV